MRFEVVGDGIGRILLDAPPLNLLTWEADRSLARCVRDAEGSGVGALILESTNARVFSAGDDVKEFPRLIREGSVEEKLRDENCAFNGIAELGIPTVAALKGVAVGGGLELALCCDFRIAGRDSMFGFPEISLGVFPGSGALFRLPLLVGEARAKQLMMLGDKITAEAALGFGLVTEVVAPESVSSRAAQLAALLASKSRVALRAIKGGMAMVRGCPASQATDISLAFSKAVFGSDAAESAIAHFSERG